MTKAETNPSDQRSKLRPLISLLPLVKPYKWQIGLAIILLLLASAQTLLLPGYGRELVDYGVIQNPSELDRHFILLLFAIALLALTIACRYFLVMWIGERVVADLRKKLFGHLLTLDAAFYTATQAGELSSRLAGDAELIRSAFGASASIALRNLLLFSGGLGMMIYHQPWLTLIILVTFPPLALALFFVFRLVRKQTQIAREHLANAVSFAAEITDASRTVQAENYGPFAIKRFSQSIKKQFRATQNSLALNSLFSFFTFSSISTAILITLWLGVKAVASGEMTEGELLQFLFLAAFTASSVAEIGQVFGEVSRASGAAVRIGEILATKSTITSEENAATMKKPVKGAIRFSNLSFSYEGPKAPPTLRSIDTLISPGEKIGLVGPSGAGKSTLFSLILRLYDPTEGEVIIDDRPISSLPLEDLRQAIAYVPQDPVIFATSLFENVRFGRQEASEEEVLSACASANALEFVDKLPKGLETEVGPRGITLSGGQKQRIAIARAILRDAPILLLDEATSALDVLSENLVQQALERLMEGRTTLVIAHRLATVASLNRILVLQDGRLVEDGSPEELAKSDGLYARMAALQFVTSV